jgi:hypothetical protein
MFQHDLFADPPDRRRGSTPLRQERPLDLPAILERLSSISERPRHAFMVLNLIAKAGGASGRAGPFVSIDGRCVPIREWLCDAIAPMAHRDPRRIARAAAVRAELDAAGTLPSDPVAAVRLIDEEVRTRVRRTGLTHISRAVSDLVRAGLIKRHYQGYRVDHENRGAQRHAVYTLLPGTRSALAFGQAPVMPQHAVGGARRR